MQQYFEGKTKANLNEVNANSAQPSCGLNSVCLKDMLFANERIDNIKEINYCVITHSTFANMGFKGTKFTRSDFSFCTFIDCYFKSSSIIMNYNIAMDKRYGKEECILQIFY